LLRGTSTQAFHPADFRAIGRAPTEDLRALAFSGAGRPTTLVLLAEAARFGASWSARPTAGVI